MTTSPIPIEVEATAVVKLDEQEIDAYRQRIENLADLDSGAAFTNNQPAHARVIFETFFDRAQKEVTIFCRNLASNVFDSSRLADNLVVAVKRGVQVRVFTQEDPQPSAFLKVLKNLVTSYSDKVSIKRSLTENSMNKLEFNFAVMDGKAYRFEPNKDDFVAFASMNNPDVCKSLLSLFQTAEKSCAI